MSIVCHYFKSTLQSYKIVGNIEKKHKKITSLREVKKTLKRTSSTSAVKSGNFSAEVCQLLWRSFRSRQGADFCPCSPLGKLDASFEAKRTRGVEAPLRVG